MIDPKNLSSLKKFYIAQWKFFRQRFFKIFIFTAILFILTAVLAHVYFINNPEKAETVFSKMGEALRKKIPFHLKGLSKALAIFANNTFVSLLAFLLGFIPFLFIPGGVVIGNGIGMGIVSTMSAMMGLNSLFVIISILPHGIIELPAFLYSASMGIYMAVEIFKRVIFSEPEYIKKPFAPIIRQSFITFVTVITPLLFLAALIETFITPILMRFF